MKTALRYFGYAVAIAAISILTLAFFPFSLAAWALFFVVRFIWLRRQGNTPEEREMMRHVRAQAHEEAERIRLQARIDRTQHAIIERAEHREQNRGRLWRRTKKTVFWVFLILSSIVIPGVPLIIYLIYRNYRRKPA